MAQHYADLAKKPFFPGLVEYMASGPVVGMVRHTMKISPPHLVYVLILLMFNSTPNRVQVWEGLGVVATGRKMLGETRPADSAPGTIRGDYCIHVGR